MSASEPLNTLDFPLHGTRLIEASAGTGKTYTIAALYVRLIVGHRLNEALQSQPLLPPDILVVTFTEASTKELRDRIRDRLSSAARYFRQNTEVADPFLQGIRHDFDKDQWTTCAQRLELAANWMDEAAVYTIHGWCNRMLQQHAFDSGSLFRQEVNTDDTELLNRVVRDYWRTYYYALADNSQYLGAIFAEFQHPDALQKALKDLLSKDEPLEGEALKSLSITELCDTYYQQHKATLAELKSPWKVWAGEIRDLIDKAVTSKVLPGANYKSNHRAEWFRKIEEWAVDSNQVELKLGTGFINLSTAGMASLVKSGTPPTHPGLDAIGKLPEQLAALPTLKTALIEHAVHWMRQRCASEKNRLAQMSFNDMLTRLDAALQGENGDSFAQVIRTQFPIALIDEFQDTDPVQYRIFEKLYPAQEENGLGCFMIGDPKQAIYSFRGADIFTYLKAHQATLGKHYTLDTNFRSTQDLVKAVNQLFLSADAKQAKGAFLFKKADEPNPLPFVDVKAKGRDDVWVIKGQAASSLTCWTWDSPEAISQTPYRETMAEITASEIIQLLNSAPDNRTGFMNHESNGFKPLQPSDIAILVRTGNEAKMMRKALAKRQLSSVYLSERDSIYASREAADVLLWLKALAEPRNEFKVRAALSTATFGFTYQQLQHFAVDEASWEVQLDRFNRYHLRWQQEGILPALRLLINDFGLHFTNLYASDGERCLTNLLHIAELLQKASTQLEGEQALIRYLAEAVADEHQATDENILRLESDANLIKIVTIHKSKGLEYPLVFLPFICSFREPRSKDAYYRYHDDNNVLQVDLNKSDTSKTLADTERLQEDLRLLYVAMTRARYACWLGLAPVKSGNTKACQLEKSAIGYLLGWQSEQAAQTLRDQLIAMKGDCESITIEGLPEVSDEWYQQVLSEQLVGAPRIAKTRIADNWWIASYSALKHSEYAIPAATAAAALINVSEEPENAGQDTQGDETEEVSDETGSRPSKELTIYNLPKGAGPGVLIHSLLEQCGREGFKASYANADNTRKRIDKLFNQVAWEGKTELVATALEHWLSMPLLDDDRISLADLEEGQYRVEMEFLIGAEKVNVLTVDQLVNDYCYSGQARPKLNPNTVHGLMKGFIDLVFVHNKQYYVADYKFNSLGSNDLAYTKPNLEAAMLHKRYDLQLVIYVLALHRLLKSRLGETYDYDSHIGGGVYLFLRGSQSASGGRVVNKPPKVLIEALDDLFAGTVSSGDNL